ncbi:hypothetical protein B0H19DRAFT_1063180 [Mycena capillaripes]|nr:hypothetical protein B0H19DRAFT_1063180 [Mycena capillaripes]
MLCLHLGASGYSVGAPADVVVGAPMPTLGAPSSPGVGAPTHPGSILLTTPGCSQHPWEHPALHAWEHPVTTPGAPTASLILGWVLPAYSIFGRVHPAIFLFWLGAPTHIHIFAGCTRIYPYIAWVHPDIFLYCLGAPSLAGSSHPDSHLKMSSPISVKLCRPPAKSFQNRGSPLKTHSKGTPASNSFVPLPSSSCPPDIAIQREFFPLLLIDIATSGRGIHTASIAASSQRLKIFLSQRRKLDLQFDSPIPTSVQRMRFNKSTRRHNPRNNLAIQLPFSLLEHSARNCIASHLEHQGGSEDYFGQTCVGDAGNGRGMERKHKVWVNVPGGHSTIHLPDVVIGLLFILLATIERHPLHVMLSPTNPFRNSRFLWRSTGGLMRSSMDWFPGDALGSCQSEGSLGVNYHSINRMQPQYLSVLTRDAAKFNQSIGAYVRFDDEPFADTTNYVLLSKPGAGNSWILAVVQLL